MSFRLLLIYRDCWFGLRLRSNVLVFAVGLWHQVFALLCTVYIVCRGQAPLRPPDEPCSGAGEISTSWTPVMDSQKTVYVLVFWCLCSCTCFTCMTTAIDILEFWKRVTTGSKVLTIWGKF